MKTPPSRSRLAEADATNDEGPSESMSSLATSASFCPAPETARSRSSSMRYTGMPERADTTDGPLSAFRRAAVSSPASLASLWTAARSARS